MNVIRQQLLDKGYCVANGLDAATIDTLRSQFAAVFDGIAQDHGVGRVQSDADLIRLYQQRKDLWVAAVDQIPYLPQLLVHVADRRLLALASDAGIRFPAISGFGVSLLVNMPSDDARLYRPHQDIAFIPGSLNGITIWVPLQDSPLPLGPLEVVPGSHQRGLWPTNGATDVKKSDLIPPVPEEAFQPIPINRGQCIVFSKFLLHRSGRNRTSSVRYSLQFRYNDLASPEYRRRNLTFGKLDPKDARFRYEIDV